MPFQQIWLVFHILGLEKISINSNQYFIIIIPNKREL